MLLQISFCCLFLEYLCVQGGDCWFFSVAISNYFVCFELGCVWIGDFSISMESHCIFVFHLWHPVSRAVNVNISLHLHFYTSIVATVAATAAHRHSEAIIFLTKQISDSTLHFARALLLAFESTFSMNNALEYTIYIRNDLLMFCRARSTSASTMASNCV